VHEHVTAVAVGRVGGNPPPPLLLNNAPTAQACETDACPVDCQWGEWAAWTCDAPSNCNGQNPIAAGISTRNRVVTVPAANGGKKCRGSSVETKDCSVDTCLVFDLDLGQQHRGGCLPWSCKKGKEH
jgi:hypothetical protein